MKAKQEKREIKKKGKPTMKYNNYRITMNKKNDENKETWLTWATGSTVEEAIKHADFWNTEGDKLAEDFEIINAEITGSSEDYPYEDEDAMRKAFANKEDTIARIEAAGMCEQDEEDLKKVVRTEDPAYFTRLDTACRDWFWLIMKHEGETTRRRTWEEQMELLDAARTRIPVLKLAEAIDNYKASESDREWMKAILDSHVEDLENNYRYADTAVREKLMDCIEGILKEEEPEGEETATKSENAFFQNIYNTACDWEAAKDERKELKRQIIKEHGYGSPEMDAWYKNEENFEYPYTTGAIKAYEAWEASETDEVLMTTFCWDSEREDFISTLRQAGIKTFIITDHSTGLMEDLHGYAALGCKMLGLCTVSKKADHFGKIEDEQLQGIRFSVN